MNHNENDLHSMAQLEYIIKVMFDVIGRDVLSSAKARNGQKELAEIIRHVADWVGGGCQGGPETIRQELTAWTHALIQTRLKK